MCGYQERFGDGWVLISFSFLIIVVAAFFLSFDLFCFVFSFACSVTTEVAEFTQVIYGTISYRIPASIIFFWQSGQFIFVF